jgi:hypothetical protein
MAGTTTALTGRNGKLSVDDTLVARLTQWQVSPKLASSSEWGDSDTEGYTARMAGRKDSTFSTEGKYDTDSEQYDIFFIGDKAAADLWMDATSLYWAFPCAMCSDFSMTVNVDSEEVIGWSASFGADGIFYYPGQVGAPVRSLPT